MPYHNDTGFPSVTQILSTYSMYDGIPKDVLDKAADRGTRCHDAIAKHLNGEFYIVDVDIEPYFNSFLLWSSQMIDETVCVEDRLVDTVYGYTGQIDCVARLHGDTCLTLIDWKTTAQESKTWPLQTAAYSQLFSTQFNKLISRRLAIRLHGDGTSPTVYEYRQDHRDFSIFIGIFNAFNYFQKG